MEIDEISHEEDYTDLSASDLNDANIDYDVPLDGPKYKPSIGWITLKNKTEGSSYYADPSFTNESSDINFKLKSIRKRLTSSASSFKLNKLSSKKNYSSLLVNESIPKLQYYQNFIPNTVLFTNLFTEYLKKFLKLDYIYV